MGYLSKIACKIMLCAVNFCVCWLEFIFFLFFGLLFIYLFYFVISAAVALITDFTVSYHFCLDGFRPVTCPHWVSEKGTATWAMELCGYPNPT